MNWVELENQFVFLRILKKVKKNEKELFNQ